MLQLILVPVIMVCALGGTVGILKVIQKLTPGEGFPKDPITRRLAEKGERLL